VLADLRGMLRSFCEACGVPFDAAMLSWAPGRRPSDGVWAPAWREAVERSTGFAAPRRELGVDDLPGALKPVAESAQPIYERLARHKLSASKG
jgi:hypothetical protein